MNIQLLSDLHFEFESEIDYDQYQTDAEVLVLAGDIDVGDRVNDHLLQFAKRYKHVVFVPGNHEFYTHKSPRFLSHDNIYTLEDNLVNINGVWFIGSTLWSDPPDEAKTRIADFRYVNFDSIKFKHYQQVDFLKSAANIPVKKVFVTHFLPARECISPYWQKYGGVLNNYFANDLGYFIESLEDSVWLHGHTHDSVAVTLGSTRIYCNPGGYRGENKNFNKQLRLEV